MNTDLLTRLRQWADKPNEGDPIIDAMAGDLAEAAEFIEAERARVVEIIEGQLRANAEDGTDGELWVLRHVLDAVNEVGAPPAAREAVAWQRITRRWHPERVGLAEVTDDPETAALWRIDPRTADVRELFATEDSRGLFAGRPE